MSLLIGNTMATASGAPSADVALYAIKTAIKSGFVNRFLCDRYTTTGNVKVALYDSNGDLLSYGSGSLSGSDTEIYLDDTIYVFEGEDYYIYAVSDTSNCLARATSGTDYDCYYTFSLSYAATPPSNILVGPTWVAASTYDFAAESWGFYSQDRIGSPFLGGGF